MIQDRLAEERARQRATVRSQSFRNAVAAGAAVDSEWLGHRIRVALAERDHTLGFLGATLRPGQRVLEVGSGLGLTSAVLAAAGVDVTSIEPGGLGFEDYERTNLVIRELLGVDHPHHPIGVDELEEHQLGLFDLIFSNNVLEHVPDVERALTALDASLAVGAEMVHGCPNYAVPYEPHFGLPLVPMRPAATARLLPRHVRESGLWRSLNWITARQVARVAERHRRTVEFTRGTLADSVARLGDDEEFAARHGVLARLDPLLRHLLTPLRAVPPRCSTPMVFRWCKTA
jgi:2-polyprenyl-3-methyl-5-hydroxy-6-metoxy-1,4-benzoquinol methylase